MTNIPYLLALQTVDGLGPIRLKVIIDYFQDPEIAWNAASKELLQIGITKSVVENLEKIRKVFNVEQYLKDLEKANINWVTIFDPNYPKLLSQIYAPPVVLYYKGTLKFNQPSVAVVGTRKITGYGQMVTEQFSKGLAKSGVIVVSGLAKGVDTVAHRTTVQSKGITIAVLGGGLNRIFPPENTGLAGEIVQKGGAIVSEFAPDAASVPGNFPARNRIISGLSKAVLVTEAAQDSGSLITARYALEQGRDVFAVPGPINSTLSFGPIDLIKEGARVATGYKDILDELGIDAVLGVQINIDGLSELEKLVYELLESGSLHIDEIGRNLKLSASQISAALLKMEIRGVLKSLGNGIYSR